MFIYLSEDGYGVYVENDGDDMWVSVRHKGERLFECIAGDFEQYARARNYVANAYRNFYPANYVSERMKPNDGRARVFNLAKEAQRIDYVLERAMYM